jgi:DNA gyrase subunit B
MHPQYKLPGVTLAMTKLHAGGKFGEGGGYKVSGGLHGVGVSCVNAISERLEVIVWRSGKVWREAYCRGKVIEPLVATADTDRHGTMVRFWPDPEIFPKLGFSFESINSRLRQLAYLNPKVKFSILNEQSAHRDDYHFTGGLIA